MNKKTKTIVVLSGGMDSTTLLYKVQAEGKEVKAISFNYGQRHSIELEKAYLTCKKLNIPHKIIDLDFMKDVASNSALTGDIEVPEGHYEGENMKLTVVPNRNMIMASIAIAHAVNDGVGEAADEDKFTEIALGVHSGDHVIYPDCRPEFIEALDAIAKIANFKEVRVYAPYLNMDKGDILIEGKKLGVDYSLTHTCYKGNELACGKCGSCQERLEGFKKAGMEDPVEYE